MQPLARFRCIALFIVAIMAILSGCASTPLPTSSSPSASTTTQATPAPVKKSAPAAEAMPRRGAYYQDDGPGDAPPPNLDQIADAEPRVEPYSKTSNKPYNVFGTTYVPDTSDKPFKQRGVGSWYGRKFHGQKTSSGELYDMYAMTAAHPTLPLPSYARVTNLANGKSVIVRVNDRGPFLHSRVMDLSYAAALKIGYLNQGSGMIEIERLLPRDILAGNYKNNASVASAVRIAVSQPVASASSAIGPSAATTTMPIPISAAVSDAATGASGLDPAIPEDLLPTPAQAVAVELLPSSGNETLPAAGLETISAAAVGASVKSQTPDLERPAEITTVIVNAQGFLIQLGAFRSRALADEFRQKITAEIAHVLPESLHITSALTATGEWFRVQLGPYAQRSLADAAATRLRNLVNGNGRYQPIIVQR